MQNQPNTKSNLLKDEKVIYDFTELSDFLEDWEPSTISCGLIDVHNMVIDMMELMHNNKLFLKTGIDGISTSLWYLREISEMLNKIEREKQ